MEAMNIESFRLADYGPRLGTRLEGETARAKLAELMQSLPARGQARISLHGLDVLSTSFADEVIGKTYAQLIDGAFGDRSLVLETPTLDLADGIDVKLIQRQLAMLCRFNGRWRLIGLHTPSMSETLNRIHSHGVTTTKVLAEELGLQMSACVNRVTKLAKLGLVHREKIGVKGPQDIYEIHAIVTD